MTGDGDGVGDKSVAGVTGTGTRSRLRTLDLDVVVVVMIMTARVNDAISQLMHAVAERVVVTVFVVVTHLGLLVGTGVTDWLNCVLGDLDILLIGMPGRNSVINGEFVDVGIGVVVITVTRVSVYSCIILGTEALTILTFSDVDWACKRFGNVDVDVSLSIFRMRLSRTTRFVNVMFVVGTGTVVLFLLT